MQSPELLEQTASERLTLDQEYEMQQSWFHDENSNFYYLKKKLSNNFRDAQNQARSDELIGIFKGKLRNCYNNELMLQGMLVLFRKQNNGCCHINAIKKR